MNSQSVQPQRSHPPTFQSLWESLLDARIRFQKALTASNLLPSHAEISSLPSTQDALHALLDEALLLSEDLFQLQEVRSSASAPALRLRRPPSIYLKPTVKSPLRPESASRSIMGETTQQRFQLLQKRSLTWKARTSSFLPCPDAYSRSLCAPGIIHTSCRPFRNGPTRSNPSHHPFFCHRTAIPFQGPRATNSRTPSSSSPNRTPTKPVGPRWLIERGCTEAGERRTALLKRKGATLRYLTIPISINSFYGT